MQSLSGVNESYKNFFERESGGTDRGSKKGADTGDSFAEAWGWWALVDSLTNSRVDKWDHVLEWNIIKALNVCCYYKDKQKLEAQQHREMMQKAKHGR